MPKFQTGCIFFILHVFMTINLKAETGITNRTILLGMSNSLSGPASAYGQGLKRGALAYFNKINSQGGIHGRKIKVISYDDGYEPVRTANNTRKLLDKDRVFALFNYVGTPTSKAAAPLASRAKVPYIAPFTGAEFLRTPPNSNYINIKSSYNDETATLVKHFIEDLRITKIGAFIQDDGYGRSGKMGIMRALRKHKLKITGIGKYKRNTVDIAGGLKALKKANPEGIIMICTYKACAAFIKAAVSSGFKPYFANLSVIGAANFIAETGKAGEGSYIAQVMPHPIDSDLEIVKEYQVTLGSGFDYISLEGYINAKVLCEALKATGRNLNRNSLREVFKNLRIDIGGMTTNFSPRKYQAFNEVYLTKIVNGQIKAVKKMTRQHH